jgi:hypothetical protein
MNKISVNSRKIFVGKPEGKRPLRTPRRRREDNIRNILDKWKRRKVWTKCIWLRTGSSGGLL